MLHQGVVVRGKFTVFVLLLGILFVIPFAGFSANVTLAWDPSPDPQVVGYRVYYGVASGNYTNSAAVGAVTNATLTGLVVGTTYYFAATAFDTNGVESIFSNETSYTPAPPVNQPPTLNALVNVAINESAGLQTVSLSGISSGATNEVQTLVVTASSSNPALIPNPTVNYTSPNSVGTLSFTPVAFAFGSATVTVQVNDGGASNNVVARTFTVTVNPVNQAPTLNALVNVAINEGAGLQTVSLSGISSGATNEVQTLVVTASSSNPTLIPNPTVTYTSPNSAGTLSFTPVAASGGSATITVTVNDGDVSNNTVTRTFVVTVNRLPVISAMTDETLTVGSTAVPIPFTISDAETTASSLILSASSDNQNLVRNADIVFGGTGGNRTVNLTPLADQTGGARITITVSDGQASAQQSFQFTVRPKPLAPSNLRVAQLIP